MDILQNNGNFTLSTAINGPLLSAVIALIMVTAFVANLFVICITFCYTKSWKQPSTIYLTSLLLADLVLVTVMPFGVISNAYGEWIFGQSVEEKYGVCQFAAYMLWYSGLLMTVTLSAISLDRFLFIVKPLFYRRYIYMKPQIAVTVVIIIWIVCAILNSTPLYGLGRFQFRVSNGFCMPMWQPQSYYFIYVLLIFSILYSCTVLMTIWTCCSTYNYFKRAAERRSGTNVFNSEENIYTSKKREVIGIFGVLVLTNAISFLPSLGALIAARFVYIPDEVYALIIVCVLLATIGNPLVQVLFREDIKVVFKNLYSTLVGKCSPSQLQMNTDMPPDVTVSAENI